jgi:Arc/MetJ family transcription regulator
MTVTSIDLDPELIEAAKKATGATTIKEAVIRSMQTAVRVAAPDPDFERRLRSLKLSDREWTLETIDYPVESEAEGVSAQHAATSAGPA